MSNPSITCATAVEAIRDLAVAIEPAQAEPGAKPYVLVPEKYRVEDLERLLPAPRRIRRAHRFCEPDSFVRYLNDFATPATLLLASEVTGKVAAIIDHDLQGKPSWGEHVPTLELTPTPEWQAWTQQAKQAMKQMEFAEFLEEHGADIISPSAADMMAIALRMRVDRKVNAKSQVKIENGEVRFAFEESVDGSTECGMAIPQTFVIGIRPFRGLSPFRLTCLLRWRMDRDTSRVAFHFVIQHADKAKEQGFRDILDQVKAGTGKEPLLVV